MTTAETTSLASPEEQSVTFIELFFDLVFVFSVTQVTHLLHHDIGVVAVVQAALVFWIVWWAWTQFTWTLNAANTDHPKIRFMTLVAVGFAFFMAVAVPGVFEGSAMWFAIPYVLLRIVGLWVYAWVATVDEAQLTAVRKFSLVSASGLVAVIAGAVIGGPLLYVALGLAILLDIVAALVGGRQEGWGLHAGHFVERHGLIVIIALGESLIVAGSGLASAPQDGTIIGVSVLAVLLTCTLWWMYFPRVLPALEHALDHEKGSGQSSLARDAFSLAHFPLLCGVIAIAATFEKSISHPHEVLALSARVALASGLVLFSGSIALAQWRALQRWHVQPTGILAVAGAAIVGLAVEPWITLAIAVAGVTIAVLASQRSGSLDAVGS